MRDLYAKRRMASLAERMQRGDADPDTAIKELTAIVEAAVNRRHGLPAISDVSNLISSEIVLPPDITHGLLHAGGKMVRFSHCGSYWHRILRIRDESGTRLYNQFEIQPGFFSERCKVVADAKDISPASGSFDVWNLRGQSAELSQLLPAMLQEAGVFEELVFHLQIGNLTKTPVTGSTALRGGALPAPSDQVWKCMVSVGPMLIRIRSTSTSVALCASAG